MTAFDPKQALDGDGPSAPTPGHHELESPQIRAQQGDGVAGSVSLRHKKMCMCGWRQMMMEPA